MDNTLIADCSALLAALAAKAQGREWGNGHWDAQVKEAVTQAEHGPREQCGAYAQLNDAIEQALPDDGILVRDITVSGSLGAVVCPCKWPADERASLAGPLVGLPMAIGTAIANPRRKIVGPGRRWRSEPGTSESWRRWRRKRPT